MQIQIKNRFTDAVIFECDAPEGLSSGLHMRHALEQAVLVGANLRSADLRSANLGGANLGGANLGGADLRSADLGGANLRSADLRSANLGGANLRSADLRSANLGGANLGGADLRSADLGGADLRSADLGGANLRSADLGGANLRSADLGGANLRSADLGGANLRSADLRSADLRSANLRSANLGGVKNDLFDILLRAPREVSAIRVALLSGKVNGSVYEGSCACLVGTIAIARGTPYRELGNGIIPDSGRPAESWFLSIKEGDTPENSEVVAITVEWIDEFSALLNNAIGSK